MWTETSSFAGYTSTSESSNITKIPGVGNPALHMLQIPSQNTNTASEGKPNHLLYLPIVIAYYVLKDFSIIFLPGTYVPYSKIQEPGYR